MSLLQRATKRGTKYQNPVPTNMGGPGLFFKILPLYFSNRAETEPRSPLGPFQTDPDVYATPPSSGLRVTWFGHSGMLVEIDGFRVLIDPVWEKRASPVRWFGPERFFEPTLPLTALPKLDVVLVSHDHYDHLGAGTIQALSKVPATSEARWVTSLGVGRRLRKFGVAAGQISELDWTESAEMQGAASGRSLKVTAWPARHFSGRTMWDRFTTLWSSFVLEGPEHRVYYGADSGTWPGFAEIAAQYDRFDLTMLEIGAFHPLWATIHLGPDGAADAYRQMGGPAKAGLLFPIHWGLFNLALHGWREPIERMTAIAAEEGWPLWAPTPGVPTEVKPEETHNSRWWERESASREGRQSGESAWQGLGRD